MVLKNAERIKESLINAAKISIYAGLAFKVLLICYIVLAVLFFCYSAFSLLLSGPSPLDLFWAVLQLFAQTMSIIVTSLIFATLIQVFGSISKGLSPFTITQSKRLQLIGWLLLADAVIGTIVSMSPLPAVQIGLLTLGIASPKIDLTPVLGAVIFFCFSYVFKYGSLLQQLTDDTV